MEEEVVTTANFESDMWDDFAANVPDERAGGDYADLPKDTWVVAQTANSSNGKAAPEIRNQEIKRGEHAGDVIVKFSVGLLTVGGEQDKILAEKHRNKISYMDAFLLPGPKEDGSKPVSGRFTAILNALFSPGVGEGLKTDDPQRTLLRWQNTIGVLRAANARFPECKPDNYTGTTAERRAKTIAGLAVALLEEQGRTLLFKTRERKYTPPGGVEKKSIEVGTFEDDTPLNRVKRKVVGFPSDLTF